MKVRRKGKPASGLSNAYTRLRLHVGKTQRDFCKSIGICQPSYHRIEHGEHPIPRRGLDRLVSAWGKECESLGLSRDDFVAVYRDRWVKGGPQHSERGQE